MKNKLTIQNSHLRGSVFAIQLLAKQNFRNFFVFVEITILIQINVINVYLFYMDMDTIGHYPPPVFYYQLSYHDE